MKHEAYINILKKKNLSRPILPLVDMNLSKQEIEELKDSILELDKENHLESCGREIAMCFAYWFHHEYSGGRETRKAEEVAEFIGLDREKGANIARYALNALKAWGVDVQVKRNGNQKILGTLFEQGGTPNNYIIKLVEGYGKAKPVEIMPNLKKTKERNDDGIEQETRTNYLGFLTALLRESPNFSSDWDKALENAQDIVYQLEANNKIPDSLKTPYQCRQYILIIRGIVEDNNELINSFDKGIIELINKLKEIYKKTNKEVKDLSLRWKLRIVQGQIIQYYSLINYNLIDPEKYGFNTNNCNSFELIIGKDRIRYFKVMIDNTVIYRAQSGKDFDEYFDGTQPIVQAQILLGGQSISIKLKNDTPINFETPQIFRYLSDYYVQSTSVSEADNIVIFNDEWHCNNISAETVNYNNERYSLVHFDNNISLINNEGEEFSTNSRTTDYSIEIEGANTEGIFCPKYILAQNGPDINVYAPNGNNINNECKFVYRVHQKYNERWKTKEEWDSLPIGFMDVKIGLPDGIQKSYTFFEMAGLMPEYIDANGDTTIIKWDNQNYPNTSIAIEETENEYFQIEKQKERPAQWKLSRRKGVAYRPVCTFHLKANSISGQIDIQVKTLFKANFITKIINGHQYELENEKVLSYGKIDDYAILVSNENDQDVPMTISYVSSDRALETKTFTIQCDHKIHMLSDYKDAIDELIENRSHLHGFITSDKKLEIKIGDNRTYYLRRYTLDIDISDKTITIKDKSAECHLKAIPFVDPGDNYPEDLITSISSIDLLSNNGYYTIPSGSEFQKFLIYSSNEDDERAVPKLLDTTMNLDDQQRNNRRETNIESWKNALDEEIFTCRNGVWDLCARYLILADEESIHFSAFNCLNVIMSDDLLLAKFIVHMILVDNGNSRVMHYLKSLEHEFIFSSSWISKSSWKTINREFPLNMIPGAELGSKGVSLTNADSAKKIEYSQKWQPALFETRKALLTNTMENGRRLFNVIVYNNYRTGNSLSDRRAFRNNVNILLKLNDIPYREEIKFNLRNNYYADINQINKPDVSQFLLAAMYLAEVIGGIHPEIWEDENYRIRKQIIRCQDYNAEIFAEVVTDTLDVIFSKKLNK